MGYHDVAQICLNGHVITHNARRSPQFCLDYCKKCGEKTIMNCPECNTPIQGEYHVDGVVWVRLPSPAPKFCHSCGHPYPWTKRCLDAAKELADELEGLSDDEKDKLKLSLDDLYRESPKTELSIVRFKRIMGKVGQESYSAMKSIIIGMLSEATKKAIFGG